MHFGTTIRPGNWAGFVGVHGYQQFCTEVFWPQAELANRRQRLVSRLAGHVATNVHDIEHPARGISDSVTDCRATVVGTVLNNF